MEIRDGLPHASKLSAVVLQVHTQRRRALWYFTKICNVLVVLLLFGVEAWRAESENKTVVQFNKSGS